MIRELTIKAIATYDESGVTITDLKKINFIYGANGCGKTTITKFIHDETGPAFPNCQLKWNNDLPLKALVYNKDFRERNFGKGSLPGVFTLGQATSEQIAEIQGLQIDLADIKENGIKKKVALEKLEQQKVICDEDFKEAAWTKIYKKYEVDFKEAFTGVMRKDFFKIRVINERIKNTSTLKSIAELREKAKTIFGKVPTVIPSIPQISYNRLIEIEQDQIWKKKIIGKADVEIAKLIQKLNLNDWVNEGREYLQENPTCPFCQSDTISADFRKQLEDYFDESFMKDTTLVKNMSEEYIRLASNLSNQMDGIEKNEKINVETKLDIALFSTLLKTNTSQFTGNRELMSAKLKEPSRSIDLVSTKEQLKDIAEVITRANKGVADHNTIVQNYTTERADLIKSVWRFLAEENAIALDAYIKQSDGMQEGIDTLQKQKEDLATQYLALKKKIELANKNVTSVQPSVDQINGTLKHFGFSNFEIVPSLTEKNQYQIHREDGSVAESTLSEGEVTFITFLYFLQLAKGSVFESTISDERVLVIDDPISSLDSNILFVVSSLIKEIIKEIKDGIGYIKQLVLLTHNVYFHKEVSFVDGRTPENGETHFWILRRNKNVSEIQHYGMKNPIKNSYELLWHELRVQKKSGGVGIQNTMRRIIENYFRVLGKYGNDELIAKFDDAEEREICRSLISWINDGSHSLPDDLFIEQQDTTIEKYWDVFKNVFDRMDHLAHYDMMMGVA